MIRGVRIENFKSIEKLHMELGRLNVFIGENGCGKSNVLEAIAFASAADQDKLDHEFLASRGIRTTEPRFMRAAFAKESAAAPIRIELGDGAEQIVTASVEAEESATQVKWVNRHGWLPASEEELLKARREVLAGLQTQSLLDLDALKSAVYRVMREVAKRVHGAWDFLVYSPENTALRTFQREGQILPLGIQGEGLFAHLKALSALPSPGVLDVITGKLALLDWFERLEIPGDLSVAERSIRLRDRYLAEGALFDQRSANEGFLFLLFYFTLFLSPDTPPFFAVDNVDASLNPKLCAALVKELAEITRTHGKQVILTTHNPAILDGLDIHDPEQRLFVIHRSSRGPTKARRVPPPKPIAGEAPVRLSEAFLRGYLGGLPKGF